MEFVCPDPRALVRAANVRATLDAFAMQPDFARRQLAPFELRMEDLRPDNWVPLQRWLDALRHLKDELGPFVLRQVGAALLHSADFPPHLSTVEDVLRALDAIHRANHQGEVGRYEVEVAADGTMRVRCATPYPRQMERGLVEAIARHPRLAGGQRYAVRFAEGKPGSEVTCTLLVRPLPASEVHPSPVRGTARPGPPLR